MKPIALLIGVLAVAVIATTVAAGEAQATRAAGIEKEMRRLAAYEVDLVLHTPQWCMAEGCQARESL